MPYERPDWVQRLPEMAGAGVIRPETVQLVEPTYGERIDPETGETTLVVENPLPEQMTPEQAQQAAERGYVSPQRAQEVATGIEQPTGAMGPTGEAVSFAHRQPQAAGAMPAQPGVDPIARRRRAAEYGGRQAQERMGEAYDARREAVMTQADLDAQRAERRGQYMLEQQEELARVDERNVAREQNRQTAVQDTRLAMQEAEEGARYKIPDEQRRHHQSVLDSPFTTSDQKARSRVAMEAAQRVDPDAIFGPVGSGERIGKKFMAAIAIGLGAFGAALTKSNVNHAAKIVQQQIDASIAEQREAFARSRQSFAAKRSGYADMMQRFGDERAAEAAQRNRMLSDADRYIQQMAARIGGPDIMARAQEMSAQLEIQKEGNLNDLDRHAAARADRLFAMEEQKKAMAGRRPGVAPQVSGLEWTGQPVTADDIKKVKTAWSTSQAATSSIDRAIELRREHGAEVLPSAAKVEMDVLQNDLITLMGQLGKAGVMAEKEVERYSAMVGKIGGVFSFAQLERLEALKGLIHRKSDAELGAHGYQRSGTGGPDKGEEAAAIGFQED